ncbi:hypothetical protein BDW59DRAFT_54886 [Aspergillus cavernicola]|uniref:BZIP domain-containing protein n=1 Tax=Aspergillus cavernicola TaxID=176166 RepID=A0ABR4IKR6_9EURO
MADNLAQTLSSRCFLPDKHTPAHTRRDAPKPDGPKKRGRPRMAQSGGAPHMNRRAQIRYAQRTYRHKKEIMHRSMEKRVAELESTMNRVSDSISDFYDMAIESDLHITHPQLFQHLRDTVTNLKRVTGTQEDIRPREIPCPPIVASDASPGNTTSFGYMVSSLQDPAGDDSSILNQHIPDLPSNTDIQVERPLPGSMKHTYSFQETDPSRILHRYCLEYTYRLFSDPRSDPQEFHRVFRLVPCVKYREKMGLYLLCLVRSGSYEPLEIPALPFYCIGGAGTHYPRLQDGKPIHYENMRLPRRVLGPLSSSVSEDIVSMDREKLLKLAGLDGSWLDCHDVVGYLREKGVIGGDVSSLSIAISSNADGAHPGMALPSGGVSWSLDVNGFFQAILRNMVILGRSPGFRLRDVEAAFTATLRIDSE